MDPLPSQKELQVWRNHCDFKISQKECKWQIRMVKNIGDLGECFSLYSFTQVVAEYMHSIYKIPTFIKTEFLQKLCRKQDTKFGLLHSR